MKSRIMRIGVVAAVFSMGAAAESQAQLTHSRTAFENVAGAFDVDVSNRSFKGVFGRSGHAAFATPFMSQFVASLRGFDAAVKSGAIRWDFAQTSPSLLLAPEEGAAATVAVPEPATGLLFFSGLLGLGFVAWRRREDVLA